MSCEIKDRIRDDLADWIEEGIIIIEGDKARGPDGKLYENNINSMTIFDLHSAALKYLKAQHAKEFTE